MISALVSPVLMVSGAQALPSVSPLVYGLLLLLVSWLTVSAQCLLWAVLPLEDLVTPTKWFVLLDTRLLPMLPALVPVTLPVWVTGSLHPLAL
jgi:hypothetical protein